MKGVWLTSLLVLLGGCVVPPAIQKRGHCVPIDPFYLTWKAREYGISTRFIELAGEINTGIHLSIREPPESRKPPSQTHF